LYAFEVNTHYRQASTIHRAYTHYARYVSVFVNVHQVCLLRVISSCHTTSQGVEYVEGI